MPRLRTRSLAPIIALSLACSKPGEPESGTQQDAPQSERPPLHNPSPSAPAPTELVPALDGAPIGMQPGYVDGGFLYASIRLGALQDYLQSLPLPPEVVRDFAELGATLGADPRVDDLLVHLGLDPQARMSLSLRPIVADASAVQQTLDAGGAVIDEIVALGSGMPDAPPAPPASSDALRLVEQSEALGVHMRWHVPVREPGRLRQPLESMPRESQAWATTCASLQPVMVCEGSGDTLVVVREQDGAWVFDVLFFFRSNFEAPDSAARRTQAQAALALPGASAPAKLATLRGDATLAFASTPAFVTMRAAGLAQTVSSLRWEGRAALERLTQRDDALRSIHDVDRVFEGMTIEANLSPTRVHANLAWLLTPLGEREAPEMFGLLQVDADVPALASLCEGSLLCARSRGVPSSVRFAKLAKGPFADPQRLVETLERGEEEAMTALLLLESWPNAIGSIANFPGQTMQGTEAVLAENSKKAAERVLAFGVALRSLSLTPGQPSAQWVAFARMPAMDLATIRGVLRLAEVSLAPTQIEGVPGSIDAVTLPDAELPARFYAISDPPITTGEWGWAVLADGDERVRWMSGLPRDDGAAPVAYLEIRDLWALISGADEPARDLAFAQAWLSGRRLQMQWDQGAAGPSIRMLVEKP